MPSLKEWTARGALFNQSNISPEALKAAAVELIQAGYLADAVDFLAKAEDAEALRQLLPIVVEEGNYFLFKLIAGHLGADYQPREDLEKLLNKATQLGLHNYAGQAKAQLDQINR